MSMTRRQALLAGASSLALMAFSGGRYNDRGLPSPPAASPPPVVQYVDAIMMHSGATEANEFTTWDAAQTYFQANVDPATQRARLIYEYSTTAYGDTQVPDLGSEDRDTDKYSLHVQGESGGLATAIDDTYAGDDVTSQFSWSLPGGVVSPIGAGDLTVELDGVKLRLGRDYRFVYDTYISGGGNWPSTSGSITLITWTPGTPSAEVVRPLATGETLRVRSIEARPVIETTSKNPVDLGAGTANPEKGVPPYYIDYYGVENLVCTCTVPYSRSINVTANNCRINKVFIFKTGGNGIGDTSPSAQQNPRLYDGTQFELINSTLFDCTGENNGSNHNIYNGWFSTSIFENVVSTDPGFFTTSAESGHCIKAKARKGIWMKDCILIGRGVGEWMGRTYPATGQAPLSLVAHTSEIVLEDCLISQPGSGRSITITTRKSPGNVGTGAHSWGKAVYTQASMTDNFVSTLSKTSFNAVEWNIGVTAGTSVFNVTKVSSWDYWDAQDNDDLVVSVWEGVDGEMPILLTSDQFSSSLTNGEGTVDLSGGASPAYPSGVPAGSIVFVSCHFDKTADFWNNSFWQQVKICGVFATGYASGATASVNWSQADVGYGKMSLPADVDFHVSVNGTTLTLGDDYTVTGGGTTTGTINFSPSLGDGDFYMITTDAHKTQGIPAVNLESIHSKYYNETYAPGGPAISPWVLPTNYRWPTVHRSFIQGCTFLQKEATGTDRVLFAGGTLPHRDDPDENKYFHGLPVDWAERSMHFATDNDTWNFNGDWSNADNVSSGYGLESSAPNYGGELFRSSDGAAPTLASPSKSQLPAWWLTFDRAPSRIVS